MTRPNEGLYSEILIVEDNENSLNLLTEIMVKSGFQVRQAQDGEMALMTIENKHPDLILLDVRMPHMDGFEVCKHLKNRSDTQDIPIIFLTANDDADSRLKGLELGAIDYLGKPFNSEEVLLRVKSNLELRRLQSNLNDLCSERTKALVDEISHRKAVEHELRESQRTLSELSGYLQEVREQERAHISREIHDQLGQTLTAIKIQLVKAKELTDHNHPSTQPVSQALSALEEASGIARDISENLRPGMLDVLGLCPTLEDHVNNYSSATGIHCDCDFSENPGNTMPSRVAIAALRIVQETLTNVVKHANADLVVINVKELDDSVHIQISDNGIGFDEADRKKKRSFGLIGMQERVKLLNDAFKINSIPGLGTTLETTIPYYNEVS